ncbi:MAG TPA: tetratricopeptide repeat protein [Gemmatimonadetes bacterium]|nr:tetratricopeptide repeat protein [Gemmatimonadota bacterium]
MIFLRIIQQTDDSIGVFKRPYKVSVVLVSLLWIFAGCFSTTADESFLIQGDEAIVRGDLGAALAEYRMAVQRGGSEDPSALVRVAHTHALMGNIDEAGDSYLQAVTFDPDLIDQAVSDLVQLAQEAMNRSDLFGLASAMEIAKTFRPGIMVDGMALPLARHYFNSGQYATALSYYQSAISDRNEDTIPEVIFEAASAYDEVGDCRRALLHYEQYRAMIASWRRGEVDWKIGNCSIALARELRSVDADEEALVYLERAVVIGEPRSLQSLAYFEIGEILFDLNRCEEAMQAFLEVSRVDQTGTSPLVSRARWRYDELRFVGSLGAVRGTGC